ncbi:efflux RND transporter periplasmic adaptor subunit [Rufibacter soli]
MKQLRFLRMILVGMFLFAGCTSEEKGEDHAAADVFYTCPMHPQVRSETPGACPICNMTLVKVSGAQSAAEAGLMLTDQQRKLANIEVYQINGGKVGGVSTFTAKVVTDENTVESVTARVAGRLDRLLVRTAGERVQKGQPLYELYSEQLLAAQQEYLLALKQEGIHLGDMRRQLAAASRQKLQLWGMTSAQINQLAKRGKASPRITYYSPVAGTVTNVPVQEGSYVAEGTPVLQVADLTSVWVQAELYPGEGAALGQKTQVRIVPEAFPQDTLTGKLVQNNPVMEKNQQLTLVSFKVSNVSGKLKPGMLAYLLLQNQTDAVLMVPTSAIVPGEKPMVWIENKKGGFEARMVELGTENKQWVEVLDGLYTNEKVVVRGTYLLNSEYILKKGTDPMAGHNH